MGLAALMLNALAARCVWHCGVLLRLLLAAPLLVLACGHALRSQTACCSWLPCCAGTNEGSGRLSHNEIRYCLPQTGLSSTMGDLITAPAAHVEARSQNARFFWVALFPSLPACPSKTGDSWWLIPCLRGKKLLMVLVQHTTTKWLGPSGRDVAQRGCEVHKVTRLQLRRVGGSATIEEVNRDDTDDGLAPRLRSH